MGKAVIYTRVSTKSQEDGYSLDVQERDGRRYCAGKHEVVAVETDTFTGHDSLEEREGMQAAIKLIRKGAADTLVIWRVDRAGRFMLDNLLLLRDVSEAGGSFESVAEGIIPNTPMGKLILSVHSYAGETEWESIRDRTQAGINARLERGSIMPGAMPLWGYRWEGEHKETYAIDPVTGPIVADIFDKADHGWSARRIANWLNDERISTPRSAAKWTRTRVLEMLKTESYTGNHVARRWKTFKVKVRAEDGRLVTRGGKRLNPNPLSTPIPALISVEQFQRVQVAIAERRYEHDNTENTALLRGFAWCGCCKQRMVTVKRASRKHRYYRCRNEDGCSGHGFGVPVPAVDADIWAKAWAVVKDNERWERVTKTETANLAERYADALRRAETTSRELEETREHAALVYERMSAEKNDKIYARNRADLEGLEDRLGQLETRLSREQEAVAVLAEHQDYHQRLVERVERDLGRDSAEFQALEYEDLTREEKRRILRLIEARVEMFPMKPEYPDRWTFQFAVHQTDGRSWTSSALVYTWADWLTA